MVQEGSWVLITFPSSDLFNITFSFKALPLCPLENFGSVFGILKNRMVASCKVNKILYAGLTSFLFPTVLSSRAREQLRDAVGAK